MEQILLFPSAAPRIGRVRRKALKSFPYDLVYQLEDGTVFFLAIAHQKKSQKYWIDRLLH